MINASKIYFSYTGSPPYVLNGVDFQIAAGQYVSVVGDNGSGKSTLMRIVLGLISPSRGSVTTSAARIGYVPQRSSGSESGFPLTVYEMLNSYRRMINVRDKSVIQNVLRLVGMDGAERLLTRNLSGGQSQKTLIARALIGTPDLLVLDEPSTGIDTHSASDIYKILRRLNTENGMTVVSVEHNLTAAASNSTVIYHLSGGRGHICTPRQFADEFLRSE